MMTHRPRYVQLTTVTAAFRLRASDTCRRLLGTMQRGIPYLLQVEVPLDVAAIAIITLHPAGRDTQGQTFHQKRLWAKNVASSIRKQTSSKPLLAYSGEHDSGLMQPSILLTVLQV